MDDRARELVDGLDEPNGSVVLSGDAGKGVARLDLVDDHVVAGRLRADDIVVHLRKRGCRFHALVVELAFHDLRVVPASALQVTCFDAHAAKLGRGARPVFGHRETRDSGCELRLRGLFVAAVPRDGAEPEKRNGRRGGVGVRPEDRVARFLLRFPVAGFLVAEGQEQQVVGRWLSGGSDLFRKGIGRGGIILRLDQGLDLSGLLGTSGRGSGLSAASAEDGVSPSARVSEDGEAGEEDQNGKDFFHGITRKQVGRFQYLQFVLYILYFINKYTREASAVKG